MKKLLIILLFLRSLLFATSQQDTIEQIGTYVQILIPLSAWSTTLITDDTEGQIDFYKSFGATFVTTHILKNTVKRRRPDGSDTKSFPSGHTSASFQGASFIHFRYGFKYAILPYLGAAFVGYSRVQADKHYVGDVIAGAVIGAGFAWFFTKPYKVKDVLIKPIVFKSQNNNYNLYGVQITF